MKKTKEEILEELSFSEEDLKEGLERIDARLSIVNWSKRVIREGYAYNDIVLTTKQAQSLLDYWMETFSERHPQ